MCSDTRRIGLPRGELRKANGYPPLDHVHSHRPVFTQSVYRTSDYIVVVYNVVFVGEGVLCHFALLVHGQLVLARCALALRGGGRQGS